ncbi:MAG: universal stress protein, partial [Burkholderiales bacterium]
MHIKWRPLRSNTIDVRSTYGGHAMYKRILVPVDGSTTSTLGLNEAIGLAAEQGAQLRILNVVDELIL